jgi:hypothetical protein
MHSGQAQVQAGLIIFRAKTDPLKDRKFQTRPCGIVHSWSRFMDVSRRPHVGGQGSGLPSYNV